MLIKCSECGGQVSDRASACPHCGAPVETQTVCDVPPVKTVDVAAAVNALESAISDNVSQASSWLYGRCSAFAIIKQWNEFCHEVEPTSASYDDLADKVALSIRKCLVSYVECSKNYSDAIEVINRALKIARSEGVRAELKESCAVLTDNIKKVNAAYGKLHSFSMESEMEFLNLETGNGEISKCCRNCRYLAYHTQFAFIKCPVCMYETRMQIMSKFSGLNGVNQRATSKKIELSSVCEKFKCKYPSPESLSRSELMEFGIIQHAVGEGFSYVGRQDMTDFGQCEKCKHHIRGRFQTPDECELRGTFSSSASKGYCRSFIPSSPEYYMKIRD